MLHNALPAAAQDYPLLNLFWTMLWFFLWVFWLFLLIQVAISILRSDDLSGWGKAAWLVFVIVLPYLGVFAYLIARGGKMEPLGTSAPASDDMARGAPRPARGTTGTADELSKLAALHDKGVLNDAEFASQKAAVLR
jgi:hypothetical protein